ncbi:MAG: glycosyltransferase family 4 protein [Thermodesulfobacteriota bacterium]|nr:glycosyltransferase family 4 protein [Thermodesulfobacteriota bacterium]
MYGNYPKKKGALEEYFMELTRQCNQLRFKTVFLFSDYPPRHILRLYNSEGADTVVAPQTDKRLDLPIIFQFAHIFRQIRPALINISFGMTSFNALLGARLIGLDNVVWTKHSFDLDGPKFKQRSGFRKYLSLSRIQGLLSKRIIAVSNAMKEELRLYGIPDSKIHKVYLGINLQRFRNCRLKPSILKEFGLRNEHKVISAISQARPEKGLEYLIRAIPEIARTHSNLRVLIVGGGPLTHELEKLSERLNFKENVVFCDVRDDVENIVALSRLTVLPSLTEGLGLSILESMAGGRPVVATNVGGIPEVITDGMTGYLVEPRNERALAERVIGLLTDDELLERMSLQCLAEAEKYDVKQGAAETIAVYDKVIK